MGGAAFPALDVLRLTEKEWTQLRNQVITSLLEHFADVSCPKPAPEKADHGDVDILVANPRREVKQDTIREAISATHCTQSGAVISYAVPHPSKEGKYAQVDVQASQDGYLDWDLWCAAYGDLVQILGLLSRKIGLTINDKGLNLRVEELESTNRKKSMIFLSKDPREVMGFLGLDVEAWYRGFDSQDDIFMWCSMGRFYSKPVKKTDENAADRARLKKRPMFTNFIEVWLPNNSGAWNNVGQCPRKHVLEEALEFFDIREQYDVIIAEVSKKQRYEELVETIGASIPAGKSKGMKVTMRGIKRWVTWANGRPTLEPEERPQDVDDSPDVPAWLQDLRDQDMDPLVMWIKDNYLEIRAREERRGDSRGKLAVSHSNKKLEA